MPPDFLTTLQTALEHPRRLPADPQATPAAVLVPFFESSPGEWRLLFTLRTDAVDSHKGQVSFPGGRSDPEDSNPAATALREAREEIGLEPGAVRVIGQMDEMLTVSHYRVTPVVGVIPWPVPLWPNRKEVAEVFSVPLAWLAEPGRLEAHYRLPPGANREIPVYYFQEFENKVIWGHTAAILVDLLTRLGLMGA